MIDPVTAGAIAAPVIGGIVGAGQASSQQRAADKLRAQALAQFAGINLPSIEAQSLDLDQLQNLGTYNPQLEQLYQMGPSELENINVDPRLKQSQMNALDSITQVANSGVTDADKASLELIRRQAAQEAQAKQGQILQEMQARGQGGSGAELIARLKSSQSSADRLNQQALQEEVMKQQARREAMMQQANMASNIRSQDYGQERDAASAQDAINQFNTQNQQNLGTRNTGNLNQAQQMNLANAQRIAEANAGLRNQQQQYNKQLQQQQFGNQMQLANARSNAMTGNAQAADNRAGQTAGMYAGIGQGVGNVITALNQPAKKTQ